MQYVVDTGKTTNASGSGYKMTVRSFQKSKAKVKLNFGDERKEGNLV